MNHLPRIPKDPGNFDDYMNNTDYLQLSHYGTPPAPRYELFGWTQAESAAWTGFRTESNLLFAAFADPKDVSKMDRLKMDNHIAKVRKYDNDKTEGHHLLDKVALNGTLDDCGVFNVVRGTLLQATPVRHEDEPTVFEPELSFKGFALGQHVISAKCSGSESRKLPEGMQFLQIYRYIGATKPAKLSQYELIGNAKRGIYRSNFPDLVPAEDEVLFAWYYARYVSKKGRLGNPGDVIHAPLMLAEA